MTQPDPQTPVDPNSLLARIRTAIQGAYPGFGEDDEDFQFSSPDSVQRAAFDGMEAVEELDAFLRAGGALPDDWTAGR